MMGKIKLWARYSQLELPGMNFSLAQQRVLLSAILRKYELSLPEDSIHKDGLQFNSNLLVLSSKNITLDFKRRY